MGQNLITVTKGKKKARIVESSLRVWQQKGWQKESKDSAPATKKTTASGNAGGSQ